MCVSACWLLFEATFLGGGGLRNQGGGRVEWRLIASSGLATI